MAKHNWQTTERMCIYCGAVVRRDMQPCVRCGGSLEWSALDLFRTTVTYLVRTVALLILVPVLLYLIGTLSPLQIVVERNPAEMRAGGACYVTMPAVRTLIQIREQCPTSHVLMPYPQQVRTGILFFDAQRNEPWARTVTTLYDAVFLFVDTIIEWTAAGMTLSDNIPQHAHAHREWLV